MAKTAKSRFVPPFVGRKGDEHGSSMARWKARGRLPISVKWTFFASSYGWDTKSGYWSESLCSKWGGSLSAKISGRMGRRPPTTVGVRILKFMGYHVALFAWSYV